MSDGLVPPLQPLKILTVGGSHTNCFLRQVIAGTRCIVEGPMNVNGFLNMEHVCTNPPELKIALQRGLKYFIVHWQAAWAWPALADFMQDSLNVEAKLDQSEIEVMLKIHKLFTAFAKANPNRDPVETDRNLGCEEHANLRLMD